MSSATTRRSGWSSRWVLRCWCGHGAVACDGSTCCGSASKQLGGEGTNFFEGFACVPTLPTLAQYHIVKYPPPFSLRRMGLMCPPFMPSCRTRCAQVSTLAGRAAVGG